MDQAFVPDPPLEIPAPLARTVAGFSPSGGAWEYEQSHAYCRHLAQSHYENFHVGSWLFPREIREHAYNFYAYCRWSDDLADEAESREASRDLLTWWRGLLEGAFRGHATHPVFVALARTIGEFNLPPEPFNSLLDAFEMDQEKLRYQTFDELLGYCSCSANPVGHVILSLLGYQNSEHLELSDLTCTALQLANHWQDIERDLTMGRIYIPQEDMDRFGVNEEDLAMPKASPEVRTLVEFEVSRTRSMFEEGLPLCDLLEGRARFDIELFSRGGMATLNAISSQGFDVLARRPKIGKVRRTGILLGCLARRLLSRPRRRTS